MFENETTILKNLDKKVDTLDSKVRAIDKKLDKFIVRFDKRMDLFEGRMDRYEESNRKMGVLLERLDTKFDFAIEGYGSLKTLLEGMNDRLIVLEGGS